MGMPEPDPRAHALGASRPRQTESRGDPLWRGILAQHLPSLRRYARALTGSQPSGDDYVGVTLEAILTLLDIVHEHNPKVALFRSRLSEALVGGIAVGDLDNDVGLFSGPTHQPTGATAIGKSAFNDRCGSR